MELASLMFCLCITKLKFQFKVNFAITFAFYSVIITNDDSGDFCVLIDLI